MFSGTELKRVWGVCMTIESTGVQKYSRLQDKPLLLFRQKLQLQATEILIAFHREYWIIWFDP